MICLPLLSRDFLVFFSSSSEQGFIKLCCFFCLFFFNALKFVDHVPSRFSSCKDNASMKNLNFFVVISLLASSSDRINGWKHKQASKTNYAPLACSVCVQTLDRLNKTRQNDVAKPLLFFSSSVVLFKKKKSVCEECFCTFHQVLDFFLLFGIVYWKNAALCQKC